MNKYMLLITGMLMMSIFSCTNNHKSDAYGNFEATEIIISSEAQGKIMWLNISEGDVIEKGTQVGLIDTTFLHLKKEQILAQKHAIAFKSKNILSQMEVLKEQKSVLLTEKSRVEKLLKDGAATQKQYDDITGKLNVTNRQISSVRIQNSGIFNELEVFDVQVKQLDYNIEKCKIIQPLKGTILTIYTESFEVIAPGKPMYKFADLTDMDLKVYVSGSQLSEISLNKKVKVLIDKNEDEFLNMDGIISWISSKAEFTPKIIQTKKERVDMVYAVKVSVKNKDGLLKIGMPGEINFK